MNADGLWGCEAVKASRRRGRSRDGGVLMGGIVRLISPNAYFSLATVFFEVARMAFLSYSKSFGIRRMFDSDLGSIP